MEGWNTYMFDYYHDGSWWSIDICARSIEDARERLNKLPQAKLAGEVYLTLPVELGWLAKLIVWWRNLKGYRGRR